MGILNNSSIRSSVKSRRNYKKSKEILSFYCEINGLNAEYVLDLVDASGFLLRGVVHEPTRFLEITDKPGGEPLVSLFSYDSDTYHIRDNRSDILSEVNGLSSMFNDGMDYSELEKLWSDISKKFLKDLNLGSVERGMDMFGVVGGIGRPIEDGKLFLSSGSCFFKDPHIATKVSIESVYRSEKLLELCNLLDDSSFSVGGIGWILPVEEYSINYGERKRFLEASCLDRGIVSSSTDRRLDFFDTSGKKFINTILSETKKYEEFDICFPSDSNMIEIKGNVIHVPSAYGSSNRGSLNELKFDTFTLTRLLDDFDGVLVCLDQYHTEMVNLARSYLEISGDDPNRISMVVYSSLFGDRFSAGFPKRLHDSPVTVYGPERDIDNFPVQTLQLNSSLVTGKIETDPSIFKGYVKSIRDRYNNK